VRRETTTRVQQCEQDFAWAMLRPAAEDTKIETDESVRSPIGRYLTQRQNFSAEIYWRKRSPTRVTGTIERSDESSEIDAGPRAGVPAALAGMIPI